MGNTALQREKTATIHASLARSRRSSQSARSYGRSRRTSNATSMRRRDSVREPLEQLPPNVEHPFELDVVDLKMIRNLCGCAQPLGRVDLVVGVADTRRAFIDRRIALHASALDVHLVRHELELHCYLTRQHMLATAEQKPHPHLVVLYGYFEDQQTLHMLTEYYVGGSLLSVMLPATECKSVPLFQTDHDYLRAAQQLCAAVAFLHDEGVAHMDISLENLFVDVTGALRLGDFRHSVFVGKLQSRGHVAPSPVRKIYGAPELYTGREVDLLKTDAWSVGIVLTMLLTEQTPLSEATTQDHQYRLLQVLGVPAFLERMIQDSDFSPERRQSPVTQKLLALVTDLLECEPDTRISMKDAIAKYPWLSLAPAAAPKEDPGPGTKEDLNPASSRAATVTAESDARPSTDRLDEPVPI